MRGIFGSFASSAIARGALAVALATGVAAAGIGLGATAAQAKEKAPKPGEYSKEFVAAAGPLQKTMQALEPLQKQLKSGGNKAAIEAQLRTAAAPAPAQIAAAEAAAKTPADRMAIGNWALSVGGALGDAKMQQRGLQTMVDSGLVPAANQLEYKFFLGNLAYNNQDYATATRALGEVVAGNYSEDGAAELLADAYARQGQPAQGLEALKTAVAARRAAGGTVPEKWYGRANTIAYNAKLGPQAIEWSRMLATEYPTALNWLGAAQLVREFSTFANQESLDLGRLMQRTGAFNNDPKFVEREYIEYIEAGTKTGVPAEVVRMTEAGVAAGILKKTDPFVNDALRDGNAGAARDRASLAADEKAARAGADGKGALASGDSYLSLQQPAKAEELFKLALAKGGIDKDRANTRLGIALIDQGKYAEAKTALAQVGGVRADLAKLWAAFAESKEKGAN